MKEFVDERNVTHKVFFLDKHDEKMANWLKGQATKASRHPLGHADISTSKFDDLQTQVTPENFYTFKSRIDNFLEVLSYGDGLDENLSEAEYRKYDF